MNHSLFYLCSFKRSNMPRYEDPVMGIVCFRKPGCDMQDVHHSNSLSLAMLLHGSCHEVLFIKNTCHGTSTANLTCTPQAARSEAWCLLRVARSPVDGSLRCFSIGNDHKISNMRYVCRLMWSANGKLSVEYFRAVACRIKITGYICAPFEGNSVEKLKKSGHEQTYIPAIQYQTQKQAWFPQAHVNRERSCSIGFTP